MSHTPPIPDAAKSPYPATPAPHDQSAAPAAETQPKDPTGSKIDKRVVAGVAGIAVGSAAIAAALLFAGRASKPKSAAVPEPAPRPSRGDAGDIGVD